MSDGKERILEHDYDGIHEYDNPLPRWWTWIFWATVAFAVAYAWNPRGVFYTPRLQAYERSMAAAAKQFPQPTATVDAAALALLGKDANALALGKTTFTTYCAACHRADAGGMIGPNLTDDYWLHGGTLTDIHNTVTNGVLEKGMPPWGKTLKPDQIDAVVAYVASLKGSNPPDPKPAQGVLVSQ